MKKSGRCDLADLVHGFRVLDNNVPIGFKKSYDFWKLTPGHAAIFAH